MFGDDRQQLFSKVPEVVTPYVVTNKINLYTDRSKVNGSAESLMTKASI